MIPSTHALCFDGVMQPFRQVDVFSVEPWLGNPLAVVHDADDWSEHQMAAFARWTNLSETTFLCAPTDPGADYGVRIWTTGGELPFAGHPTLGSAHAWLEAGGEPRRADVVVQECGAGLVEVRREGERLAFAAPRLTRSGPVGLDDRERVLAALDVPPERVIDLAWVDNGPGWIGVELDSAQTVLDVVADPLRFAGLQVAVIGRYAADVASATGVDVEVRAFYADDSGFVEDPVTGSANAGLAQWLMEAGRLPERYVAAQGSQLQRAGRIHLERIDGQVWVGGASVTRIVGSVHP